MHYYTAVPPKIDIVGFDQSPYRAATFWKRCFKWFRWQRAWFRNADSASKGISTWVCVGASVCEPAHSRCSLTGGRHITYCDFGKCRSISENNWDNMANEKKEKLQNKHFSSIYFGLHFFIDCMYLICHICLVNLISFVYTYILTFWVYNVSESRLVNCRSGQVRWKKIILSKMVDVNKWLGRLAGAKNSVYDRLNLCRAKTDRLSTNAWDN